jgi:hypothetical protein
MAASSTRHQLEQILYGHPERSRQPQRQTHRRIVPSRLDGDDRLTGHSHPLGQLLLGHPVHLAPMAPDVVPHLDVLPQSHDSKGIFAGLEM